MKTLPLPPPAGWYTFTPPFTDTPHLPGIEFYDYICKEFGRTADKRDGKIGLSSEQWENLGVRYHQTMATTYFAADRRWRIKNAGDISRLLKRAGFEDFMVWKVAPWSAPLYEDLSGKVDAELEETTGSFIVCAFNS